jgi:hypothetical protein
MKRIPVSSSCIASVGYEASRRTLEIEFVHGDLYRYFQVPERVHRALMAAASHGTYYQHSIRDGGYPYERVKRGVHLPSYS